MKVREIQAKSVLTKSKLPDADFVINPYVGCSFGCMYCYAAFIGRWKHPDEKWGEFLDVKINAPELLKKELARMGKKNSGSILLSSVTDPYVGAEAKYKVTRGCLRVLADFDYQGSVSILTKSSLATRDIGIFKRLKDFSAGFTVTTTDDRVSGFLEVNAPPVSARLKALKQLHDEGVDTYAFVGPLIPHFTDNKQELEKLFSALKNSGVRDVYIEHINLSPKIRKRLYNYLEIESPELIPKFRETESKKYRIELERTVDELLKKMKLRILGERVLYHPEDK